jgi:hypothetical protein
LLYLTRIFLAATTLVQFATKLSFKSIKYQPIPAVVACMPTVQSRRGLTGVLASLGISSLPRHWKDFFLNSDRIDQFAQLSRKQKKVYAEVQLILYAEKRMHTGERLSGRPILDAARSAVSSVSFFVRAIGPSRCVGHIRLFSQCGRYHGHFLSSHSTYYVSFRSSLKIFCRAFSLGHIPCSKGIFDSNHQQLYRHRRQCKWKCRRSLADRKS